MALVGDPEGGSSGTWCRDRLHGKRRLLGAKRLVEPRRHPGAVRCVCGPSASGETALVGDPGAQTYGTATVYDFNGSWSTGTPLTVTPNADNVRDGGGALGGRDDRRGRGPNGGTSGGEVTVFSLDATTAATSLRASANPSSASVGTPVTYSATVSAGSGTPHGHGELQHRTQHLVHGDTLWGNGELCRQRYPSGRGRGVRELLG